ncbi:ACP S-malonyltransferase [Leucobacter sp. OLJS4]|uniref:ACP S-malonyltransferase n=1 Tax=unclassified Leucobacter TaxID=2621730 RepID=UPI000C17531C|nr:MULTISPECIES: ACP S-malonyltransferase [unclassified Leucobacter]PIJ47927.1 ACP S-malonyltransferase [Leucobacter sp. OLES1]PII81579.1 ACP S-malonyltransferase [Leucobacter sp. OLCALW19]PII86251.1 ACP S-malonyltransferase [Leucobacter sp. OLTLW20]PII90146.1 ACP S-malonyltransferase [Leucobacter sp. OLAS13]PII97179.1 ACP S-malonyltransferase [Leucobacter sp. OLDS2]
MIIIACPGQGSQTPGFLSEWLEAPGAREFLTAASERSGVDLIAHGTESDADTIRDTSVAQPLIVAASVLAWRALEARTSLDGIGVAGHSVGEFAAAAAAGVLDAGDALALVGTRGRAMAAAATRAETGMAAVVGGVEADVLAAIEAQGLTPANRNGGGQIVAAGTREALLALGENAPRGVRVIPLQVAGAFHTEFMAEAVPVLADAAAAVTPNDPVRPLWTNADGSRIESGARYLELLVSQIANPVRWDACMTSFQDAGITGLIELTPAGALTGIAKRALKGVPTVAVKTPADLDDAIALIADAA